MVYINITDIVAIALQGELGVWLDTSQRFDEWDPLKTYNMGDVVFDDVNFYTSKTNANTGNIPATSPANWDVNPALRREFDRSEGIALEIARSYIVQRFDFDTEMANTGLARNAELVEKVMDLMAFQMVKKNSPEAYHATRLSNRNFAMTYLREIRDAAKTPQLPRYRDGNGNEIFTTTTFYSRDSSDVVQGFTY